MSEEKCGYGCGRQWNAQGDKDGFDDCVSTYHKPEEEKIDVESARYGAKYIIESVLEIMSRNTITKELEKEIEDLSTDPEDWEWD